MSTYKYHPPPLKEKRREHFCWLKVIKPVTATLNDTPKELVVGSITWVNSHSEELVLIENNRHYRNFHKNCFEVIDSPVGNDSDIDVNVNTIRIGDRVRLKSKLDHTSKGWRDSFLEHFPLREGTVERISTYTYSSCSFIKGAIPVFSFKEEDFGKCCYHDASAFELVPVVKEYSDEGLLEEAARRYPLGTKYIPINPDGSTGSERYTASRIPNMVDPKEKTIDVGFSYVYAKGKWAEIVTAPVEEKKESPVEEKTEPSSDQKWRIKTKEEFIVEDLWNYRENRPLRNWISSMNHLLGGYVHPDNYGACRFGRSLQMEKFYIDPVNYTDKPLPGFEAVTEYSVNATIQAHRVVPFWKELPESPEEAFHPDLLKMNTIKINN